MNNISRNFLRQKGLVFMYFHYHHQSSQASAAFGRACSVVEMCVTMDSAIGSVLPRF